MSLLSVVVDLYGVFKVLVPRLNHRLVLSGAGVVEKKSSYFLRVTAYRYASSLRSMEGD